MRRFYSSILILLGLLAFWHSAGASNSITVIRKSVCLGGKTFSVKVVSVPMDKYRAKVGIARGRVGATESLKGIVGRYKAVAGINGCFFDAYTKSAIKPPYHNLASEGRFIHLGSVGTSLGFDAQGDYRMEPIRVTVRGRALGNESWYSDWYAYFLNHPIETASTATAYTKGWVSDSTPNKGTQIAVSNGVVKSIGSGSTSIPQDGFVLVLAGGEEAMAQRFHEGQRCGTRMNIQSLDPNFWNKAQEVIGCGPTLVRHGQICVHPESEGFKHEKILSLSCQRSAVGITEGRRLLLVTCSSATIKQLADVMKSLGAYDAMNMDGGASSCLWADGKYIAPPGRDVSNALLVVEK